MAHQPSTLGAFNARWLNPDDVAKTFVPVPQFRQLTHGGHSLLLGPRGCGKTTLLKMLTRPALDQWSASGRSAKFEQTFLAPNYEAIYIPADVRWSYELASLTNEPGIEAHLAAKSQRLMVSTNVLVHILAAAEPLTNGDRTVEAAISERIIRTWGLKKTLSDFRDIRASLRALASSIRGYLSTADNTPLSQTLRDVHPSFFGHVLDAPLDTIQAIAENLPSSSRPSNWALCFDELEIAPEWLRTELLEALRSASHNVFLKLTWSPLLPSGLRTNPESAADFKAIRLWHSHLADPKMFCEDLTRDFLRERLKDDGIQPLSFFSRSILAAEEAEEPPGAYQRDSTEYEVFKELASWDTSLRRLMESKGVDPLDPVPKSVEEKDQFFRKLKPIALLRSEFLTTIKGRSRKAVTLYAGREAIYAMSEGNPRWLLGLLNDFVDLGVTTEPHERVRYSDQARVLNNFSRRFMAQVKAIPFRPPAGGGSGSQYYTLFDFLVKLGDFFKNVVLEGDFPLDPVGSFVVPEGSDQQDLALVEQLLDIGAVVYVGSSPQDVPVRIIGSRFRLSYMLSPIFRLPLRLYREISLSNALSGKEDSKQFQLPF